MAFTMTLCYLSALALIYSSTHADCATIIAEFNGNVASIMKMTDMIKSIVIERF